MEPFQDRKDVLRDGHSSSSGSQTFDIHASAILRTADPAMEGMEAERKETQCSQSLTFCCLLFNQPCSPYISSNLGSARQTQNTISTYQRTYPAVFIWLAHILPERAEVM
jgi:hypothetical protein